MLMPPWECVREFEVILPVSLLKHANPCGVAASEINHMNAYDLSFKTDPTSAFGGIIAFNKKLDKETAKEINQRQFVELVIAPGL